MNVGSHFGRFEIVAFVGEGGMGKVYKAKDTELQRDVALKVLRVDLTADSQFVERFRKEAITQAKLLHPNIAQFYDLIREQGYWIMVMEFVEGTPLDLAINQRSHIPVDEAIAIFNQVLDAMESAHKKGVVHRDIKPANIILCSDGTAKVMDFGIARAVGDTRMTKTGRLVGTPNYMAPEQILNNEVDPRTDIYALGIVLYQMLTGAVPFNRTSEFEVLRAQLEEQPEPPSRKGRDIPGGIERALLKAMAKEPGQRYASAVEFKEALRIARDGGYVPSGHTKDQPALSLGGLNAPVEPVRSKIPLVIAGVGVLIAAAAMALFLGSGAPPVQKPAVVQMPEPVAVPLPKTAEPPATPPPAEVAKPDPPKPEPPKPVATPKPAPQVPKAAPLPECPKGELERRLWEVEGKKCR